MHRSPGPIPTLIALAVPVSLLFIVISMPFTQTNTVNLRKRDLVEPRQESNTSSPLPDTSTSDSSVSSTSLPSTSSKETSFSSSSSSIRSSSSLDEPSTSSFPIEPTESTESSISSADPFTNPITSLPTSTTPTSASSFTRTPTSSSTSQSSTLTLAPSQNIKTTIATPPITSTKTSISESPTPLLAAAAASNGFWENKSAVAGTFSVVGLVIVGILIALGTVLLRKRSPPEDETFFEKYSEQPDPTSPGPSVTDLNQAPMNAYRSNDVHYDNSDPHLAMYAQQEYATEYPSGTAYAHAATQQGQYQYPNSRGFDAASVTDYSQPSSARASPTNPALFVAAQPLSNPAPATGLAPPVAFRDRLSQDSYQQSIDSFYGGSMSGQAL